MSEPLHRLTARELAHRVRDGRLTARAVASHFLGRIDARDGELRAFLSVDPDWTLSAADAVDRAVAAGDDPGPLAGVPVAIKDNLCTRGVPTTCASRILAGWTPPYDAEVVTRLTRAGAVPIGKTNLDEFAMGSSTEWSAVAPTRNPWDLTRVPGGSSGGSAAAVAAGLAPIAIGSDTGGSIRQPASLCGVHGMMGTYGRVSRRGLVAFGSSLDRVGPFARTAADLATVLSVVAGEDTGDATSSAGPRPVARPDAEVPDVAGLRVGVVDCTVDVDPDVAARCDAAVDALRNAGATTSTVALPLLDHALSVYYLLAPSEASSNLARYDGVRFGLRAAGPGDAPLPLDEMLRETRERGFGPEVKRRILLGTFALSAGYSQQFYEKALRARRLVANGFAALFEHVDAIVSPTSPFPAFRIGEKIDDPLAMYACDVLAVPASLAGLPAASVPVGRTARGLPVGLQVIAPQHREDRVLHVAAALDAVHGVAPLAEAYA